MSNRKEPTLPSPLIQTQQLHETAANFAQGIVNLQNALENTKAALSQADAELAMTATERDHLRSENSRLEAKLSFYMQRTTELLTRFHTVKDIVDRSLVEENLQEYHKVATPPSLSSEQQHRILNDIEDELAGKPLPSVVSKGPRVGGFPIPPKPPQAGED